MDLYGQPVDVAFNFLVFWGHHLRKDDRQLSESVSVALKVRSLHFESPKFSLQALSLAARAILSNHSCLQVGPGEGVGNR